MARRVPETIEQALTRRADEYRRHLLLQSFAAIHHDARELWLGGHDPSVKSKAMSKRLAQVEAAWTGKPVPEEVELAPLAVLLKRAGVRAGK